MGKNIPIDVTVHHFKETTENYISRANDEQRWSVLVVMDTFFSPADLEKWVQGNGHLKESARIDPTFRYRKLHAHIAAAMKEYLPDMSACFVRKLNKRDHAQMTLQEIQPKAGRDANPYSARFWFVLSSINSGDLTGHQVNLWDFDWAMNRGKIHVHSASKLRGAL